MSTPVVRRRRRPSEVDTIQWTGDNETDVQEFTGPGIFRAIPADQRTSTPEITASVYDRLHDTWIGVYTGQHIVQGIQGEFYPIAEDVLAETYEDPAGPAAIEYGVRLGDGTILLDDHATKRSLAAQLIRLIRCRETWPEAVLVQRPVSRGEWTNAEAGEVT